MPHSLPERPFDTLLDITFSPSITVYAASFQDINPMPVARFFKDLGIAYLSSFTTSTIDRAVADFLADFPGTPPERFNSPFECALAVDWWINTHFPDGERCPPF